MQFNEQTPPPNPSMNPQSAMPRANRCHVCGLTIENDAHPCLLGSGGTDDRVGKPFNGYMIEARAGEGGMAFVYKAKHEVMGNTVAIKILRPVIAADKAKMESFRQEAISISKLHHPNIIRLLDFEMPQNSDAYLVMDYVDGPTLSVVLMQEHTISLHRCINIFSVICDALQHAHQTGVIHNDIKPSNILLGHDSAGREIPKIVDFGIAKLVNPEPGLKTVHSGSDVFGSPLYMSPEQCAAKALDARSDIYSTACVMFEALTGQPPFLSPNPQDIMQMHVFNPPPKLSDRNSDLQSVEQLDAIFSKAMAKHPDARHQTMKQLKNELDAVVQQAQVWGGAAYQPDVPAPKPDSWRTSIEPPKPSAAPWEQPAEAPKAPAMPWAQQGSASDQLPPQQFESQPVPQFAQAQQQQSQPMQQFQSQPMQQFQSAPEMDAPGQAEGPSTDNWVKQIQARKQTEPQPVSAEAIWGQAVPGNIQENPAEAQPVSAEAIWGQAAAPGNVPEKPPEPQSMDPMKLFEDSRAPADEKLFNTGKTSQFDTTSVRKPTGARKSEQAAKQKNADKQQNTDKQRTTDRQRNIEQQSNTDRQRNTGRQTGTGRLTPLDSPSRRMPESNPMVRRIMLGVMLSVAALGAVSLAFMSSKHQDVTVDDWQKSIVAGQKLLDKGKLQEAQKKFELALDQADQIKDGFALGRKMGTLQELIDVAYVGKENPDKYTRQLAELQDEDSKNVKMLLDRLAHVPAKESAGTQLLLTRAVDTAMKEFRKGNLATAETLVTKTQALCSGRLETGSPVEIKSYSLLGQIQIEEGKLDDARTNLEQGLALAKQFHDKRLTPQLMLQLSRLDVDQFQAEDGLKHAVEAEKVYKHVDSAYSHGVAAADIIEGSALRLMKKYDDSKMRYLVAMKILETLSDHDMPVESECRIQFARLLSGKLDDMSNASSAYEAAINALESREPRTPREWRFLAQALDDLATLRADKNEMATAKPLRARAAAIWKRTEGEDVSQELATSGAKEAPKPEPSPGNSWETKGAPPESAPSSKGSDSDKAPSDLGKSSGGSDKPGADGDMPFGGSETQFGGDSDKLKGAN